MEEDEEILIPPKDENPFLPIEEITKVYDEVNQDSALQTPEDEGSNK